MERGGGGICSFWTRWLHGAKLKTALKCLNYGAFKGTYWFPPFVCDTCDLRLATCDLRLATCDLRLAGRVESTCLAEKPSLKLSILL